MKKKALIVFLLALPLWGANLEALAQEDSLRPQSPSRGSQVKSYGVEQDGEIARGFGSEVPLSKAISIIVPRGYAFRTAGVDRWWLNQPVTWTGGRPWTEALREALSPYPELVVDISRSSKIVLLRMHNGDAGNEQSREMTDYVPAREEAPARAEAPAQPVKSNGYGYRGPARAAETWDIHASDKTLQNAVSRWAKAAGWQLAWEVPVDYPVDARASIGGSFEGAVEAVMKGMEKADVPMKAIFYSGNRVLRIVAKGAE